MATTQTFRTAINGFNRDDVVRYIEFLNTKHQAELNQLKSELEFLRNKPAEESAAPSQLDADSAQRIETLTAEKEDLARELANALEIKAKAEDALAAALAEKAALVAELADARQQHSSVQVNAELEAYRRAERTERMARERAECTERMARERAEQIYRQANGILSDATVKVESAADQIGALTDQVMSQLGQLQEAVSDSKQALRDAAASMYTIKPQSEA